MNPQSPERRGNQEMKLRLIGIILGIVIVIPILAWKWGFFGH